MITSDENRTFRATDARQGEIILHRRWQRVLFIAGLVLLVFVGLIMRLLLWP